MLSERETSQFELIIKKFTSKRKNSNLSYAPINGLPQDEGGERTLGKRMWLGDLISWTFPGWEIWLSRHLVKWRTRE